METYRLNSRLVESDREFIIQTSNDGQVGAVSSIVLVDGEIAEKTSRPHPHEVDPEEILSLVKQTHGAKKKELELLLQTYRKTLEEGNAEEMCRLGSAFFYKRFFVEAKRLFDCAAEIDPANHQAYNFLCMTYVTLGSPEKAIACGKEATQIQPGYADYHNNLGEAYLVANHCKEAAMEFEEATRINLYYADAYYNLGLALIANALRQQDTGLFTKLISRTTDFLRKAALIYTNYDSEIFNRGLAALKDSNLAEAYRLLASVREAKKEKHYREFAEFHMKFVLHPDWASEQAVTDRIRFLQNEISKNPTYVDLHSELGRCYLEQARVCWRKGIDMYRRTLEMNQSLSRVDADLEQAVLVYNSMCQSLGRTTQNGR
ncbi:MAG: tetratricopeptide repeat protein [Candidatus Zixiibacteriota bacterium]